MGKYGRNYDKRERLELLKEQLRRLIALDGRSEREISAAAGLAERYLEGLLSGSSEPSIFKLHALARELGTTAEELVGKAPTATKEKEAHYDASGLRWGNMKRIDLQKPATLPGMGRFRSLLCSQEQFRRRDLCLLVLRDGRRLLCRVESDGDTCRFIVVHPETSPAIITLRRGDWRELLVVRAIFIERES